MFTDTNVKIGAVLGSDTYKAQYIEFFVNDWNTQLKLLSIIVENQTQGAYLAFVSGFRSKSKLFWENNSLN